MSYPFLKLVHVLAVILFVGNITTGVFWKAYADRTRDPRIIAHTLRGIIAADRWFTVPGVVLIVLAGTGAAGVAGLPLLGTGWILWSIVLFAVSGLAFGLRLVPLQRRMAALAAAEGELDWTAYRALSRGWGIWGTVALAAPLAAAALMVLKPALPAL